MRTRIVNVYCESKGKTVASTSQRNRITFVGICKVLWKFWKQYGGHFGYNYHKIEFEIVGDAK